MNSPLLPDWPERLTACFNRHLNRPFAFGQSDCWMLMDGACVAMTGKHIYQGVRYSTETGAARTLRRFGFKTIREALAARFQEVPVAAASRGDLGIVEFAGREAGTVCEGALFLLKDSHSGMIRLPRRSVTVAFKVA